MDLVKNTRSTVRRNITLTVFHPSGELFFQREFIVNLLYPYILQLIKSVKTERCISINAIIRPQKKFYLRF